MHTGAVDWQNLIAFEQYVCLFKLVKMEILFLQVQFIRTITKKA